jgi:hypothetical protein
MKIGIDKQTRDFVKKISYVIGAIKNDIATNDSSWEVRLGVIRIQMFQDLIDRMIAKSVKSQLG